MGKKYRKETSPAEEAKNIMNEAVKEAAEETEAVKEAAEEIEKTEKTEEIVVYDYGTSKEKLLIEINKLPNGEERSRAIRDLKDLESIINEAEKARLMNEQKEKEYFEREREIEFRERELKQNNRNANKGFLAQLGGTMLSFLAYGVLLSRQNKFESQDSYSTSGSRNLSNAISRLPKIK